METREFEKLVDTALMALPEKFRAAMDNISIVVEQWPSSRVARGLLLLGLYQGIPKTAWGRGLGQFMPDKITIFKGPIEYVANGDTERIKVLIVDTVEHEIAHHFGISDRRIDQIKKLSRH